MPGKLAFLPLASAIGTLFCLQVLNNGDLLTRQNPSVADKCQLLEFPRDLGREGQKRWCDELIPRYDMAEWLSEHGQVFPDHPAVFVNTTSHEGEIFKDPEAFLAQHGGEHVLARPEYMAAGSHLMDTASPSVINVSLRRLAKIWDSSHLYSSDFKCENGSLCFRVAQQFGQPSLFRMHKHHITSMNFLVGGKGSGLPFHKHSATWQGLSLGRKAWYIVPPGSMSESLHNVTGPYLFPARTFHSTLLQKPLGKRPLFCVQHVGEVVYLPPFWWHATMNLDGYEVAYGEKPRKVRMEPNSTALAKIMQVFPPTPWDSAGFTEGQPNMVYSVKPKMDQFFKTCGNNLNDLDQVLEWMMESSTTQAMSCGLAEMAAWAHCRMVKHLQDALWICPKLNGSLAEIKQRMGSWKRRAIQLSRALIQREGTRCGS